MTIVLHEKPKQVWKLLAGNVDTPCGIYRGVLWPTDEYDGSICAAAMRAVATITVATCSSCGRARMFFSILVLQLFGFKVFFSDIDYCLFDLSVTPYLYV